MDFKELDSKFLQRKMRLPAQGSTANTSYKHSSWNALNWKELCLNTVKFFTRY